MQKQVSAKVINVARTERRHTRRSVLFKSSELRVATDNSEILHQPVIAQLVERRTVVSEMAGIIRSAVRLRLAGTILFIETAL